MSAGKIEQVGLIRAITDFTTFCYLTDVYTLVEHRGKGLASWALREMDAVIASWPFCRRLMLICESSVGRPFYEKALGMKKLELGEKYVLMNKTCAGSTGGLEAV